MANLSFDAAMKRLEEIIGLLESGEKSLEESIKLYEEGSKLSALCSKKLKQAEQKITQLSELEMGKESENDGQ